jgi:hypothetical protein
LSLRCPFCNAAEDKRVEGVDESGNQVTLLMFDCPFFFRLPKNLLDTDEIVQAYLDRWRAENGNDWLDSLGPVMKSRELKNIERSKKISSG